MFTCQLYAVTVHIADTTFNMNNKHQQSTAKRNYCLISCIMYYLRMLPKFS